MLVCSVFFFFENKTFSIASVTHVSKFVYIFFAFEERRKMEKENYENKQTLLVSVIQSFGEEEKEVKLYFTCDVSIYCLLIIKIQ